MQAIIGQNIGERYVPVTEPAGPEGTRTFSRKVRVPKEGGEGRNGDSYEQPSPRAGRRAVEALAELDEDGARLALDSLTEGERRAFAADWPSWAHDGQAPAHDDWRVWVLLAGRGFGKTRAGAEWVSAFARENGDSHSDCPLQIAPQCVRFAREAGYDRVRLWTRTILESARRICEAAGFRITETAIHHEFGEPVQGETWER